jgi:hypothetical protein
MSVDTEHSQNSSSFQRSWLPSLYRHFVGKMLWVIVGLGMAYFFLHIVRMVGADD